MITIQEKKKRRVETFWSLYINKYVCATADVEVWYQLADEKRHIQFDYACPYRASSKNLRYVSMNEEKQGKNSRDVGITADTDCSVSRTQYGAHVNPSCDWMRTENIYIMFGHTATGKQTLRISHGSGRRRNLIPLFSYLIPNFRTIITMSLPFHL